MATQIESEKKPIQTPQILVMTFDDLLRTNDILVTIDGALKEVYNYTKEYFPFSRFIDRKKDDFNNDFKFLECLRILNVKERKTQKDAYFNTIANIKKYETLLVLLSEELKKMIKNKIDKLDKQDKHNEYIYEAAKDILIFPFNNQFSNIYCCITDKILSVNDNESKKVENLLRIGNKILSTDEKMGKLKFDNGKIYLTLTNFTDKLWELCKKEKIFIDKELVNISGIKKPNLKGEITIINSKILSKLDKNLVNEFMSSYLGKTTLICRNLSHAISLKNSEYSVIVKLDFVSKELSDFVDSFVKKFNVTITWSQSIIIAVKSRYE